MNITNVTNDFDIIADYDIIISTNMTLSNCTDNENNIDIIIPTILLTIPCGLSVLCLMSLMVYTLINPLLRKE